MDKWERKEHFDFFSDSNELPFFGMTVRLNITQLYKYIKENNLLFYPSLIYFVTNEMKAIENFRYRIRREGVILLEDIIPAFTFLKDDTDLFQIGIIEMNQDIQSFNKKYLELVTKQSSLISDEDIEEDAIIQFSSLPWINYTSLEMELNLNADDSVPKITWGKYEKINKEILLPFSIQVNHRLIDGIHVAKLINNLENKFSKLKK